MITHMFIDGFKSFRELSLELAPFQVIVGANGVGKSNLFDSIRLLSLLICAPHFKHCAARQANSFHSKQMVKQ